MSPPLQHLYEFGPFRLDTAERQLLRDGEKVPLTPKAFEMLVALVERSGHLIAKDELMKAVWSDSFVEESNLTNNVYELRKLLGKGENGASYIETVPKRGYRFTAPVNELPLETLLVEKRTVTRVVTEETLGDNDSAQRPMIGTGEALALEHPHVHTEQRSVWRWLLVALLSLSLIIVGIFIYRSLKATPPLTATSRAQIESIAVLPFKPLVTEERDEALEMGMADTLIAKLSNISEINVRPLSAVRRYGGLEQDASDAGRKLGVEAVLDGTIQRSGERVRVTARLVSVSDGKQLWEGRFDDKFTDIFSVQDAISEKVVAALALKLTGEEQKQLTRHYTENSEAYQIYLYGRFYRNKRTEAGSRKAIEYFEQAIAKDPNYAPAYSGLSEGYIGLSVFGAMPPKDAFPKARAAALKALEIDDRSAESHVALAHFKNQSDRDWSGAEKDYQRAIELNPGYADAYRLYAILLMEARREDEAFANIKRALEIDPTSVIYNATFGVLYYFARRYDQAIEQLQKTIDMEPSHWMAHYWLAQVYAQKGMHNEALFEAQKARDLSGDSGSSWVIGYAHAVAGRRAQAQQQINELLELSKQRYVPPYDIAQIYAGLGDKDQAFAWLEKADEGRSRGMDFLNINPVFEPLHSDPRFAALIKRIGRA
ncbi:MAG: TPR end-of-group domain-containing protein [Acidobacteriota bacterium]